VIAAFVYLWCCLLASACAALLLRTYRRSHERFVLWSGVCFVGLAVNNAMLVVDRLVVPTVDLSVVRLVPTLVGVAALVYGLVWEEE
jgi:hypothetical protein